MVDQMISDAPSTNAYIVSDSWGLCEDALPPSFLQAESYQLQLAAAAGLSFYAASGDSGSSDCEPLNPKDTNLVVDDPASQPFVTGVGGTALHSADGADSTAWKHGGGGISRTWAQPSYQSGNPHRSYDNGTKCGNPAGFCRQVPDIALDANPSTGYIIECTSTASGCPSGIPWFPIGGTSAGAPLMAAITADANTYSRANGGQRMGFANPLLYSDPTPVLRRHAGLQPHQRLRPLQGRRRLRPRYRAWLTQGARAGNSAGGVQARAHRPGRDQPGRHQPHWN